MSHLAFYHNLLIALHMIAIIAWMAGLLYLPRLFVYHIPAELGSEMDLTFQKMERLLYRGIMNPAMIAVLVLGLTSDLVRRDPAALGLALPSDALDAGEIGRRPFPDLVASLFGACPNSAGGRSPGEVGAILADDQRAPVRRRDRHGARRHHQIRLLSHAGCVFGWP